MRKIKWTIQCLEVFLDTTPYNWKAKAVFRNKRQTIWRYNCIFYKKVRHLDNFQRKLQVTVCLKISVLKPCFYLLLFLLQLQKNVHTIKLRLTPLSISTISGMRSLSITACIWSAFPAVMLDIVQAASFCMLVFWWRSNSWNTDKALLSKTCWNGKKFSLETW